MAKAAQGAFTPSCSESSEKLVNSSIVEQCSLKGERQRWSIAYVATDEN